MRTDWRDRHEIDDRGREGAESDFVVVRELIERVDRCLLHQVDLRPLHRAGDVEDEEHPRALAHVAPRPLKLLEDRRRRRTDDQLRFVGEEPHRLGDVRARFSLRVAEPGAEEDALRIHRSQVLEEAVRDRALLVIDPGRVEDRVRVIGDESSFLRVDRHERHARAPARVAAVVVPDLLLFDGDRRHIGQRGALLVGGAQVTHEGRHRVAVVHDTRLDAFDECDDPRIRQIGAGEVARAASRREVRPDERMEARGRDVRIRLRETEVTPLGVTAAAPAGGVARELEDI